MGILITFQAESQGTIDVDKSGKNFVYTGETDTMEAIVDEFRAPHEEPADLLKRLPRILHGTMSAILYTGPNPPKLVIHKGIRLPGKNADA